MRKNGKESAPTEVRRKKTIADDFSKRLTCLISKTSKADMAISVHEGLSIHILLNLLSNVGGDIIA